MTSSDPFPSVVVGYPKLAAKTEILPEVAIYRRFGALNAQNLLYYQAELIFLERKLREQQLSDANKRSGYSEQYGKDWFYLKHSREEEDGSQLDLILKIREILKEYNQALVHHSTILRYPEPGNWDLHHIQDYLQSKEMAYGLALTGEDCEIWGSVTDRHAHSPDLVALRPRAKKDAFSVWAAENTISSLFRCGFARFMRPSRIHGAVGYDDDTIYRITYSITSILASLIPIVSIVVLYCVQSMLARLAIIAAFNVLVSICLMGFAGAKRTEVFAVTAAFAAVQVVFVSSDKSVST